MPKNSAARVGGFSGVSTLRPDFNAAWVRQDGECRGSASQTTPSADGGGSFHPAIGTPLSLRGASC